MHLFLYEPWHKLKMQIFTLHMCFSFLNLEDHCTIYHYLFLFYLHIWSHEYVFSVNIGWLHCHTLCSVQLSVFPALTHAIYVNNYHAWCEVGVVELEIPQCASLGVGILCLLAFFIDWLIGYWLIDWEGYWLIGHTSHPFIWTAQFDRCQSHSRLSIFPGYKPPPSRTDWCYF